MDIDRYFLDIRAGCAAVRDRRHPNYDETYPGLHQDMPDVVLYKHGSNHISVMGWVVKEEDIEELKSLCDKLNVWPVRERKLNDIGILD
jgi:hypothetical protein